MLDLQVKFAHKRYGLSMSKTFGNRGEEKDGMEIKYGGI